MRRPPVFRLIRTIPLLRNLAEFAAGLLAPRQPVGAAGVIVNTEGHVLLALHRTRPSAPWGIPGGWLHRGERPEDGVLREVREELDIEVSLERYVCSYEHWLGRLRPRGLSLAFRLRSDLDSTVEVRPRSWEIAATRWSDIEEAKRMLAEDEFRAVRLALADGIEASPSAAAPVESE